MEFFLRCGDPPFFGCQQVSSTPSPSLCSLTFPPLFPVRKISELSSLGFMIVGLKRVNYGPGAASHVTKFLLSLLFTPFFS